MYIRTNNPNGTTSTARINGRGRRRENCNIAVCIVTDNNDTINDLRDQIATSNEWLKNETGALNNGSIVTTVYTGDTYRNGEPDTYTMLRLHVVNDGAANHRIIRTTNVNEKVSGGIMVSTSWDFDKRVPTDSSDADLMSMMQHGGTIWRAVISGLCTAIDERQNHIDTLTDKIAQLQAKTDGGTDATYRIVTAVKDEQAAKRWIKTNGYDDNAYGTVVLIPTA
jgi:hypothetical protein